MNFFTSFLVAASFLLSLMGCKPSPKSSLRVKSLVWNPETVVQQHSSDSTPSAKLPFTTDLLPSISFNAITVTVLSVQDSRCPLNVFCFWGGHFVASLKISNESKDTLISLDDENPIYRSELGFTLTLEQLSAPGSNLEGLISFQSSSTLPINCKSLAPKGCASIYKPVICEYTGELFEASNSCAAENMARDKACNQKVAFEQLSLRCK